MNLYTVDRNPKGKKRTLSLGVKIRPSLPLFSPNFFYPGNALSMGSSEHYSKSVTMPVDRLWHVIAQRTLLGSCYAPSVEKCCNPISLSHKPKTEFQYTSIGNAAIIKIIAKRSRYCRLLLAKWNSVKHYIFI